MQQHLCWGCDAGRAEQRRVLLLSRRSFFLKFASVVPSAACCVSPPRRVWEEGSLAEHPCVRGSPSLQGSRVGDAATVSRLWVGGMGLGAWQCWGNPGVRPRHGHQETNLEKCWAEGQEGSQKRHREVHWCLVTSPTRASILPCVTVRVKRLLHSSAWGLSHGLFSL